MATCSHVRTRLIVLTSNIVGCSHNLLWFVVLIIYFCSLYSQSLYAIIISGFFFFDNLLLFVVLIITSVCYSHNLFRFVVLTIDIPRLFPQITSVCCFHNLLRFVVLTIANRHYHFGSFSDNLLRFVVFIITSVCCYHNLLRLVLLTIASQQCSDNSLRFVFLTIHFSQLFLQFTSFRCSYRRIIVGLDWIQ